MASRQQLAEMTKNFRKLGDTDKLEQLKSVIRAYQEEIDHLTSRSKHAEGAYLSITKMLTSAVDPVPYLVACSVCVL